MKRRRFLCCMGGVGIVATTGCVSGGALEKKETPGYLRTRKDAKTMSRLSEVTYCGVYCPNCEERCQIPQRAAALLKSMKAANYNDWCPPTVWKFVADLTDVKVPKRCRDETCGSKTCGMRRCAKDKGVEVCPLCGDYPCEMIQTLASTDPTLLFDGKRMKEVGLEQWIDEQEARRANGFCYGDIRCGKGFIPEG